MLAGDVGSAMLCLVARCIGNLHIGSELEPLSKSFIVCLKQSVRPAIFCYQRNQKLVFVNSYHLFHSSIKQAKYQQNAVLFLAMSSFGVCIFLSGKSNSEIRVDVMSYDDLNQIGEAKRINLLLYQNFFNEMSCYFWMRDYIKVGQLTTKHTPTGQKRILEIMRTFFEGIASLTLARHTQQPNWRKTGEEALETMLKWERISKWNFQNMAKLLEAELCYLNGDIDSADVAYKASIVSAHEHRFLHYEALAYELHGIFCMENQMADRGLVQLQMALDKYKQWGAMRKVTDLQMFIDLVDPTYLRRELNIVIE